MTRLQALLRLVAAAVIVAGVLGLSTSAAAGDARPSAAEVLNEVELSSQACGVEDDPGATVVCGGELLQEFIDPAALVMAKDTCSRLLEELFGGQACGLGRGDCGQVQPCALPPLSRVSLGTGGGARLMVATPPADSAGGTRMPRPEDHRIPDSRRLRPPSPPPRRLLS